MVDYSTVTNPVLGPPSQPSKGLSSASLRNFFSKPFLQLSQTSSQVRIAPERLSSICSGSSMSVTHISGSMDAKKKANKAKFLPTATSVTRPASSSSSSAGGNPDPLIHYNGPYDTLDQLPDEKLQWIKHEPVEADGLHHPLVGCPKSIVLRKPVTRSKTFPFVHQPVNIAAPKATFYLRVIQIVHQNTRKPCAFRCSVQVGKSICTGQLVPSEKCGKRNIQAEVDETFLFDIDEDSTTVLKVFTQPKSTLLAARFGQGHREETMIGKEEFVVPLQACEKQLRWITLEESPKCRVLVIYGTFVSKSVQTLLENKCIHEDYITVYIRGLLTPKWERFWAGLHGTVLLLYDFEYRASRPPLYTIPLDFFGQVSHPSADDERQVDAGPLGLALQFTEHALSKQTLERLEDETDSFECRMYVLPDSAEASRQWKEMFAYVASLLEQYRQMNYADVEDTIADSFTSSYTSTTVGDEAEENDQGPVSIGIAIENEEDESPIAVPSKFMW